jgi:hypothetical protein
METIWVARLRVSTATAAKLSSLHCLDADEIRQAIVCVQGLPVRLDHHEERGLRALVRVTIRGKKVLVVLYPRNADALNDDEWNLGSAYIVSR